MSNPQKIRVTLKLFATLRDWLPPDAEGNTIVKDLPDGAPIEDLVASLNFPPDLKLIVLINSLHAAPGQALKDGDTVAIFPPIAGG